MSESLIDVQSTCARRLSVSFCLRAGTLACDRIGRVPRRASSWAVALGFGRACEAGTMAGARDAEAQEPPTRALVLAVAALGDLRLLERAPGAQHLQTPAAAGCRARAFRDEASNRARLSQIWLSPSKFN